MRAKAQQYILRSFNHFFFFLIYKIDKRKKHQSFVVHSIVCLFLIRNCTLNILIIVQYSVDYVSGLFLWSRKQNKLIAFLIILCVCVCLRHHNNECRTIGKFRLPINLHNSAMECPCLQVCVVHIIYDGWWYAVSYAQLNTFLASLVHLSSTFSLVLVYMVYIHRLYKLVYISRF